MITLDVSGKTNIGLLKLKIAQRKQTLKTQL